MTLTAKTLSGIKVFAPEVTEKRQEFICPNPSCNQPMIFVDAQLKIKHFRHKTNISCDFEPETETHEYYKALVYQRLRSKNVGEVFLEHRVDRLIADIYLNSERGRHIAFEIQATNYDISKYEEKIRYYAFRKFLVVYIFVGNDFCKEIKSNIYSLKEIEKRIFNNKAYCDTVIGCYLEDEYVFLPSFKEKYAKGRSGLCTDRFILDYNEGKQMHLNNFLDYVLNYNIREPFRPKCKHKETTYIKSDLKIKRYKIVCSDCGIFLDWLKNEKAVALGLEL